MLQLWEAGEGESSSRRKRRGCPAPQVLLEPRFGCGSVPTAGQDAAAERSPGRDAVFGTTRLCQGLAVVPGHLPPGFRAPASTGHVLRRLPCSSPSPAPGRAGRDPVPCWLPSSACQQAPSDLFASSASTSEANVCLGQKHEARRIIVKYQKPLFFPQTITTFDIILISSYICYFSTLGTRYRKYKHDLLNQRRHSIPLEKETKN